jgi:hypothetical protein
LTEIYLRDPLEIDFAQINDDKIALAKQTSTENDHCNATGNVLETSFKVEKYFSTPKLFKQASIDEEEPPGISINVFNSGCTRTNQPTHRLLSSLSVLRVL